MVKRISNRHQNSKIIANGSLLIIFFYIVLAIFSFGFLNTLVPGLNAVPLLYLPIIIGFLGIGRAAFVFSHDELMNWENGKRIFIFITISSLALVLGQVFILVSGNSEGSPVYPVLFYFGFALMIISSGCFAVSFYFIRKQLVILYFKKVIIKHPGFYIIASFILQIIAYCIFFAGFFFQNQDIQAITDIVGISIIAASLLMMAIGCIQLNISFRAYPHLVEDESLRPI